jgi:hypothetical protein
MLIQDPDDDDFYLLPLSRGYDFDNDEIDDELDTVAQDVYNAGLNSPSWCHHFSIFATSPLYANDSGISFLVESYPMYSPRETTPPSRAVEDPALVPPPKESVKITIVFDLDETLISAAMTGGGVIFIRPQARKILAILRLHCPDIEIIVWSAGEKLHVDWCLDILDPDKNLIDYAVARGSAWFSDLPVKKDLRKLQGRDMKKIIIVDDSPQAALLNPDNALIIPPYAPSGGLTRSDTALLSVFRVIYRSYNMLVAAPPASVGGCGSGSSTPPGEDTASSACKCGIEPSDFVANLFEHPLIYHIKEDKLYKDILVSYWKLNVDNKSFFLDQLKTFYSKHQ